MLTVNSNPPGPCLQLASEPVVTLCGHLYCWPCLYRWLQVQNHCRTCPVCKAGVDRDKVIPIYGRGGNEDPRTKTKDLTELEVPSRPIGQRPAPVMRNAMLQTNAVNMTTGQQTLGLIPTLFGLQGNAQGQGAYAEPLTPEQQHQAFLSRLLLMLGSFVIMCCEFQYVPFEVETPPERKCLGSSLSLTSSLLYHAVLLF